MGYRHEDGAVMDQYGRTIRPLTPPASNHRENTELPKAFEGDLVQTAKGLSINATAGAHTSFDGVRHSEGNNMVNVARGPLASSGGTLDTTETFGDGAAIASGPAAQLTDNTKMPGAFGADLVESVKVSDPASTPGVQDQLDPELTNTLHKRLGEFVAPPNPGKPHRNV